MQHIVPFILNYFLNIFYIAYYESHTFRYFSESFVKYDFTNKRKELKT